MTAEIMEWAGRQVTLEDWEAVPRGERFRLELVEGVLSIMQQPLSLHQALTPSSIPHFEK